MKHSDESNLKSICVYIFLKKKLRIAGGRRQGFLCFCEKGGKTIKHWAVFEKAPNHNKPLRKFLPMTK